MILAISIHAPRVGGDGCSRFSYGPQAIFQSTPPVWGATAILIKLTTQINISIHAPRVGGDSIIALAIFPGSISIHAPRVGGDDYTRHPVYRKAISIHAPRVGGD